ncbi:DUF5343 domain-containing protein [Sphingomonas sp. Leaf357]|uniref:DUF5343 domain-containing protein n=1 Tax=Sphingomonas sp. Leaf357 TaxID=1736350 RepID=UPI000A4B7D38|nr:DUF5343 domain-containing protein [Sphingomonas sp. Leaf357]
MALPTSYLTSTKNLQGILSAIQQAKAPDRFTQRFLEDLEFKSTSDRLIIGVLKSLKLVDDQGKPTERYFQFLDQSQSDRIMADAVREAYSDLFQVNTSAQKLSKQDVINKFKTLSQGSISESVLDKMAMTFTALVKLGDFENNAGKLKQERVIENEIKIDQDDNLDGSGGSDDDQIKRNRRSLGGLHYNIQIILPESRDSKVYDALFRSLKDHLI